MLHLTQEELGEIVDITEQMCNLEGWVEEALPLAQKRQAIIEKARSCPHTAAPIVDELTDAYRNGFVDGQTHAAKECLQGIQYRLNERINATIRNATLETLDLECQEIKSRIESSAMGKPLSERERGRIIGILDVRMKIKSLRSTPKEQP